MSFILLEKSFHYSCNVLSNSRKKEKEKEKKPGCVCYYYYYLLNFIKAIK